MARNPDQQLREVMRSLDDAITDVQRATQASVYKGALFLQRQVLPRIPIDTGTLRNSAFLDSNWDPTAPMVRVGYGADYAIYVHENLKARHPVGEAKFLERALVDNAGEIRRIIRSGVADALGGAGVA